MCKSRSMKKILILALTSLCASCISRNNIDKEEKTDTEWFIQWSDTINKKWYYNTSMTVFEKEIFGLRLSMSLSDIKKVIKSDNVTYCLYEDRVLAENVVQVHFCIDKFYTRVNGSNNELGRLSASCILANDSLKVFNVTYTGCGEYDYDYNIIRENLINKIGDCYIRTYEYNHIKSILWEYENASILFGEDELHTKFLEISDNKFVFDINEAMRKYYKNKDEHYSEQKYRRSDDSFYNKDASKYDYIKSRISSGYVKDFKPAKNINGEYHTIDGRAKQIQYQGSAEQRRDLEMIDEYAIKHPGF